MIKDTEPPKALQIYLRPNVWGKLNKLRDSGSYGRTFSGLISALIKEECERKEIQ